MPPFNSATLSNRFNGAKSISNQTKLISRKSVADQVDKRIKSTKKIKSSAHHWDAVSVKLSILMVALVPLTLYILSPSQVPRSDLPSSVPSSPSSSDQPESSINLNSSEAQTLTQPEVDNDLEEEGQFYNFLATTEQHFPQISLHEVPCHPTGYKAEAEIGIVPQRCGTMILDELVSREDALKLRKLAMKLIDAMGQTNFHNRESINLKWINLHNVFRNGPKTGVLTENDFQLIKNASEAARSAVALAFGLPDEYLLFHGVCQFTRYHPIVQFKEFRHVDKLRSPNLVVTSILWLSTVDEDFGGGRTEFLTGPGPEPHTPLLVEPKIGRYAAWTSSYENPHGVQELIYGYRYALIFAFTLLDHVGHSNMDSFREWAATTDAL